ncbi:glycosyltransferase [candidate division WOR-3 bacterium]|nr:glycosyltransferase [candidate division WOR-3 bacterium]
MKSPFLSFVIAEKLSGDSEYFSIENCGDKHSYEILKSSDYSPEAVNRTLKKAGGKWFSVVMPGVHLKEDFVKIVAQSEASKDDAGMIYGDYELNQKKVELYDYNGDWTERWNFGKLRIYNTKAVSDQGFFDSRFPSAYNYDMLLKFWNIKKAVRIPQVLYSFHSREKINTLKNKLFFPAEGEYGGFSYLFYDESFKQQVEKCFDEFLVRQNIFFESENSQTPSKGVESSGSPAVAVVIPVHNRSEMLKDAVESVKNQDFGEWELIIVDNSSDDGTYETALKLAEKDGRIKALRRQDNRISKALNLGIRNASARYIAQLDSDDFYTPSTLRKMIQALDDNPDAGLAVSYYDLVDEKGESIEELGVVKHEEYSVNNILRVDGAGAVRVWKKSVLQEMGLFDEDLFCDYGEDYDMVLKVIEKYRLIRVHEVLYHYRRHPGNSDVLRDELFKLNAKNRARLNSWIRRKKLLKGSENETLLY